MERCRNLSGTADLNGHNGLVCMNTNKGLLLREIADTPRQVSAPPGGSINAPAKFKKKSRRVLRSAQNSALPAVRGYHLLRYRLAPIPRAKPAGPESGPCATTSVGNEQSKFTLIEGMRKGGPYISRRPSSARSMVTSSANSRSEPTGIPMAIRLTLTPSGLTSLAR